MSAKKQLKNAKLIKWSTLIKEQAESGLNVKTWCSRNNISKDSFYYWKRKVKEELLDSITPEVVSILPVTPNPIDADSLYESSTTITPSVSHNLYNSNNSSKQDLSSNLYNLSNTHDDLKTISISSNDIHIELPISTSTNLITGIIEVLCHA